VWILPDVPKTRSGKIMRRAIAGISNFTDAGDSTTLADREIIEIIRHHVQPEKLAHGRAPIELTPEPIAEIKAFGQVE
jgi:acetyl-CoA synthetase